MLFLVNRFNPDMFIRPKTSFITEQIVIDLAYVKNALALAGEFTALVDEVEDAEVLSEILDIPVAHTPHPIPPTIRLGDDIIFGHFSRRLPRGTKHLPEGVEVGWQLILYLVDDTSH